MERINALNVLSLLLLLQSATASDTCSSVIHVDSENGVNQSTCWAQGQAQPCDSLQLALQGDQLATSALVLHRPEDYRVMSDISMTCACEKLEKDFDVNLASQQHMSCPTWFKQNSTPGRCECGDKISDVIHCHDSHNYSTIHASILNCYCMTLEDKSSGGVLNNATSSGQLLVGACLYNCFHENSYTAMYTPYHPLPQDPRNLSDVMCSRYNRRGRLCSECMDGYHQPVYSYEIKCVECSISNLNILLYILIAFGPSTIFLFIILICRVNCAAPPLNHHIHFIQMISSPMLLRVLLAAFETAQYRTKIQLLLFVVTIYGVWNLDFFRTVIPSICFNISTLSAISLDYLVAVYPLALTVIIYVLIELHARNVRLVVWLWRPFHKYVFLIRRQWDIKSSIADTFATFMLLSCMKFASVTFDLLFPVVVYDIDGQSKMYLYYDASIEYFSTEHLPYAVLAAGICIIFIIFPIVFLLLYSYSCAQKCLHFWGLHSCFIADIAKAFHSCYKDGNNGTRNYTCFAALSFIIRGMLLVTYGTTPSVLFWGIAAVQIILAAVLIIIIQPYKSPVYNILEAIHFLLLAMYLVSLFGISAVTVMSPKSWQRKLALALSGVITSLPLLYGTGIFLRWLKGNEDFLDVLHRVTKSMKFCFTIICSKHTQPPVCVISPEDSLPDRLVNPDFYHHASITEDGDSNLMS